RGPIHSPLHHPYWAPTDLGGFDPVLLRELTFAEPELARGDALELGYRCVEEGGDTGAVLNAADEVAVAAFLAGRIPFQEIHRINRRVLERRPGLDQGIAELLEADRRARVIAGEEIEALGAPAAP
ncbi:MAG: 1-deoxy-D-xylulose-5-phosphate reductoisomerase, partial [Planctomycetota bacterium]|nr:1-deoxy-D-xylulose-5-phosphate reductoisomerase [Planctomycetota bacterium]